jgi:hypothetical protein
MDMAMSRAAEHVRIRVEEAIALDCDRVAVSRKDLEQVLDQHAVMLAALKQAIAAADAQLSKYYGDRTPECAEDYHACKAAIAKADDEI